MALGTEITGQPVYTAEAMTGEERVPVYDPNVSPIVWKQVKLSRLARQADRIAEPPAADDLQRLLDGYTNLALPDGTYTPTNRVLFLDRPNQSLTGAGRFRTTYNGTVFVGWKRGLIDDTHYPSGGYRTRANSSLITRGTPFDNGPANGRWSSLTTLTIRVVGALASGTWTGKGVTGIISRADGPSGTDPSPWYLWCNGSGDAELVIRTGDGVTRRFSATHPAGPGLDWSFTVNFTAATVTATIAGSSAAVTGTLPSGKRFSDNDRWAWSLGALKGFGNEAGWALSDPLYDATFTTFSLAGSGGFSASAVWTRPATYPGGDSLPLVLCASNENTFYAMAVLASQGVGESSNADIRGLKIVGPVSNPCVVIGTSLNGVNLADCNLDGGSYGVVTSQIAVAYPIKIRDCDVIGQTISHLYIWTCANLVVRDCTFGFARYRALHFDTSNVVVESCFIGPATTQKEMILQCGGTGVYTNTTGDDESGTAAPVIRIAPNSAQSGTWGTYVRLDQTYFSVDPLVSGPVIEPRAAGYTGHVTLDINDGQRFVGPATVPGGFTGLTLTRNGAPSAS